ncbi:MAG: arylsulfatase A-like enzyme [Planctomycetota bacterium]|jgi:arylsulfatase A-like enzyme
MTGKMKLYGMDQAVESLAAATDIPESRFGLDWMQPASAIAVLIVVGAIMGTLDWFLAGALGQPSWSFSASFLTATGTAATLGLVAIPILYAGIEGLSNVRRKTWVLGIILFVVSSGLLALLLPPLLAMPGINPNSRLQFRLAIIGVIVVLQGMVIAFAVRQILLPTRARSTSKPRFGAVVFFSFGIALQLADARLFAGGYPEAHILASLAAAGCYALFTLGLFAALEDQVPRRTARLVVLALLFIIAMVSFHVWVRGQSSIHVLREALFRPPFTVTRKVLPQLERLALNDLAPIEKIKTVNADAMVASALAPKDRRAEIEAILGKGRRDWNVVVITVDTMRADEAGWQRSNKNGPSLTPNLDRLAEKSIVLNRAHTPYPTSSYAYSSMLTGYYPRFTPARRPFAPKGKYFEGKLLTEILHDQGYATWAITAFNAAGINNDALFGHTRPGFDVVNPLGNREKLDAKDVTSCALQQIEEHDQKKPFFLWAHYMDAHAVYRQHDDQRFQFGSKPRDLYRGEIAYVDHHLQPLLQRLQADDLAKKTLIVFASDHGESFDEHDTSFHNSNLHFEQIRIPAFFHVPRVKAAQRARAFNLVDMTPTILALLGIKDPEIRQGRDYSGPLFDLANDGEWVDFSLSERFPRDPLPGRDAERSLVFRGGKMIRFVDDASARHFNLANDPSEVRNAFDPSKPRQQLQLGFMDALADRLDNYLGQAGNRFTDLLAIFDVALAELENDDQGDDLKAIISFARNLFDWDRRYLDRLDGLLGQERLTRLHQALAPLPYAAGHLDVVRYAALELLLSLPHEGIAPFMLDGLKSPNVKMRGECALWLFKRGNQIGLDILLDSLGDPVGEWNLRLAPKLVKHRPNGLSRWLLPNLSNDRSQPAIASITALSELKYHNLDLILRQHLTAPAFGLTLPRSQVSMAQAASRMTGLDANALLARLALSSVPEARRRSRETLGLRLPPLALATQIEAATQEMLADESVREKRYDEAIGRYEQAYELAQKIGHDDEFLSIKMARTMMLLDQQDQARIILAPMLGTASESRPWFKAAARGLARFVEQGLKPLGNAKKHELKATIAKGATILPVRQMTFFAREIELTNTGSRHILGGTWPWANRLSWIFRNAETGAWLSENDSTILVSRFLPAAGLAPGETIRMTAVGRTPNPRGLWIPVLVLKSQPWFSLNHKVLLELPPIRI